MDSALHALLNRQQEDHWWFAGRRKIFSKVLHNTVKTANNSILDIGCGTGGMISILKDFGHTIGIEVNPEAAEFARGRGYDSVIVHDAKTLPFADQSFDIVTAFDIIEHIEDDRQFVNEIIRVLKPGGKFFLSTAAFNFLWSVFDERAHHYRRYTRKSLAGMLNRFNDSEVCYYNTLLFPPIAVVRLLQKVIHKKQDPKSELFELRQPPKILNYALKCIFSFEKYITGMRIPFGVSLFAVCSKPGTSIASP